MKIVHKVHSR